MNRPVKRQLEDDIFYESKEDETIATLDRLLNAHAAGQQNMVTLVIHEWERRTGRKWQ